MARVALLLVAVLALVLGTVSVAAGQTASGKVTAVIAYTPPMLPESVAVDAAGNGYVSFPPTGAVVRIAPDGAQSTLTTFNEPAAPKSLGIATEAPGSLLVVVNGQPGGDARGVWRLRADGTKQLAAALPEGGLPNDVLAAPGGGFYVSDSLTGAVYRVGADAKAAKWVEHDLLKGNPNGCAPEKHPAAARFNVGANGMAWASNGDLLVANTFNATIVRVPVQADGSAGAPSLWAGPDCRNLLGADGITADGSGGLYVAVNFRNTVVQVSPGGAIRTLATAAEGLDFPSSVKVGTGKWAGSLIVTNFANVSASTPGAKTNPAILAVRLSAAAAPTQLPRTGAPVGLLVVAGGLLVGVGAVLRRRGR